MRRTTIRGRELAVAVVASCALLTACFPTGQSREATPVAVPAAPGSTFPRLSATADTLVLSWLEPTNGGHRLQFAHWTDSGWSEAKTVSQGTNWLVNWADFPSVIPGEPWAAHWLVKQDGERYAYDVFTAVSPDQGESWSQPRLLHDDGTVSEHGFVTMMPVVGSRSARVLAIWLDGRNTGSAGGSMTLRSATLDAEGRISNALLVDERVCDCCQTDLIGTDSGPVAVYRDRSGSEIRDIAISRYDNTRWQPSRIVAADDWHITGCPVNGPAVAADGSLLAVAWYTGADSQSRVQVAFSGDAGESFADPIEVANGSVMGRVDVVLINGQGYVSWLENKRLGDGVVAEVRLRRVDQNGGLGEIIIAGQSATGRPTGFPQIALVGEELIIAWTDTNDDLPQVVSAQSTIH